MATLNIVTGAFGYSGRYISALLLQRGAAVRTLTAHPRRAAAAASAVEVAPFNFAKPDALAHSLEGAEVVFNTYWIRFPRGDLTFERAVSNVKVLIDAARRAAVRRFVHLSITNASPTSFLPYFRGKGVLEAYLVDSGLSYAILRPAVIFGADDILLHNITWMLRRFPLFTIPGDGNYHVQPVFVEDLAALAVKAAQERNNVAMDAIGPETFTFNDLVGLLARAVASRAWIIHVSPSIELYLAKLISRLTGDVTLTHDEIRGLMADMLYSHGPPTAPTRFSQWLERNAASMGTGYSSELSRRL